MISKIFFLYLLVFSFGIACTAETSSCSDDQTEGSNFEERVDSISEDEKEREKFFDRVSKYFGTIVTSSPYPGVRATYEGSELMSQLSSVNQDLQLLLQQRTIDDFMDAEHVTKCRYPRLYISGALEATAFLQKDIAGKVRSDIELTDVELDFFATLNNFSKGFLSIYYDRALNISSNRVRNSRLKVTSAFGLIGDLRKFPIYGTFGQTYVPFGQYTSYYSVSSALTKLLFRTLAPEAALGFYYKGLIGSVFAYKGSTYTGSDNNINNYGFNFGCELKYNSIDAKLAVSMQKNVADSLGMQVAFGQSTADEKLRNTVPGFDINAFINFGKSFHFIAEYTRSLKAFSPFDMAYSSDGSFFQGAQPSALNVEGAYTFSVSNFPSKLALGYTSSWEALGFNVPRHRINAVFGVYIFPETLLSLEYTHDRLYAQNNRAAGKIVRNTNGSPAYFVNPINLGSSQNTVSLDLYIYF